MRTCYFSIDVSSSPELLSVASGVVDPGLSSLARPGSKLAVSMNSPCVMTFWFGWALNGLGFKTVYVDACLQTGLQPESFQDHMKQRRRWVC